MALAGALSNGVHAVAGFNNRSLRALVGDRLGTAYTSAQMTYDLRRRRLHRLIAAFLDRTPTCSPPKASVSHSSTPRSKTTCSLSTGSRSTTGSTPNPSRSSRHRQTVESYVDQALIRRAA